MVKNGYIKITLIVANIYQIAYKYLIKIIN